MKRFLPVGACLLLAGCAWRSDYDALQAQNQQLQQQNASLNQQVAALNGDVNRLTASIKYTMNSDMLFRSGSWEVSPRGQDIIAKFASQLAPTQQRKLMVNGYTDDQSVGRGLQQAGITSNEMLSQKRADSVRDYLITQGVKADMVAAKGWGEAQPIAPNTTPEGRAQNRRVEITLVGG
jgi:chemotaxis protein MotB